MKNLGYNRNNKLKKILRLVVVIFMIFSFAFTPTTANAQLVTSDTMTAIKTALDKVWQALKTALNKIAATTLNNIVRTTTQRIAYEGATYIGSGGKGQKPLFIEKGWAAYAEDLAWNAVGQFIDQINTWSGLNLCEPNLDVKASIGLGLVQYADPSTYEPKCTWKKMKESWTDELEKWKSMSEEDYLKKMASMFDPTGNDLTIGLSLMSGARKEFNLKKEEKQGDARATQGWLDLRNFSDKITGTPGQGLRFVKQGDDLNIQNLGKYTGDALVDAANVFLNQLAITGFNTLMKKLLSNNPGGDINYKDKFKDLATDYKNALENLFNPESDPTSRNSTKSLQSRANQILKPRFDVRADYTVLSELSVCLDPNKPGPTQCVIDDQFSQAIEQRKTIIEAINEGFLNKTWRLERDIVFNQGYSLRSAMILRKYRILPIGWENAIIEASSRGGASLMDMVSCFDPDDNYFEFSQGFIPGAWCEGLIDPNWVLKAPLSYCKKQGYGGYTLDKQVINIPDATNPSIENSAIFITRGDNYCADEQSCIKEKKDGSCEAYGYCTEDRRTWNFNSATCEPIYNTCQSFTNATGVAYSFLENTLDYGVCDAENAGCKGYSNFGIYNSSQDSLAWKTTDQIYFNRKVESCDRSLEGCSEIIRTKQDNGHNFLLNADFEGDLNFGNWLTNYDGINNGSVLTTEGYFSNNSLKLNGLFKKEIAVGPSDYNIAGEAYSFSFYAKNCSTGDQAAFGNQTLNLSSGNEWKYYLLNYVVPNFGINDNKVLFSINSNTCLIDRLKLEPGLLGTNYANYGDNGLAYEKIIPEYLEATCYNDATSAVKDYSLKSNAPAKCLNYARKCNASEAGCELYKNESGIFKVAARAAATDACLSECVGYDAYIQKETYFNDSEAANIIPGNTTACSLQAVGCNEFTNLDELAQGGEGREYYTYLKQCIKPDDNRCAAFYSWEGSDTNGFQLKNYSLEKDANFPKLIGGAQAVTTTNTSYEVDPVTGSPICDEEIYNLTPSDPDYNPDCRQFYNTQGKIAYRILNHIITCSENCHPYRLTDKNPNKCTSTGGTWDAAQDRCIYYAIPGEGKKCTAAENGCREYDGNQGNNIRIISSSDFEFGLLGWETACGNDTIAISSDSLTRGGKSLYYTTNNGACSSWSQFSQENVNSKNNPIIKFFRSLFSKATNSALAQSTNLPVHGISTSVNISNNSEASYSLRFLAKAVTNDATLNFYLSNGSKTIPFNINSQATSNVLIPGNGDWQTYQVSLMALEREMGDNIKLIISSDANVYLDNIVLTEIVDRYYLIKGTSAIPNSCYYDVFGNYQGVNYNLGCEKYIDRSNNNYYLRQFSRLCADSSVGCEVVIDTHNSSNPLGEAFNNDPAFTDKFEYSTADINSHYWISNSVNDAAIIDSQSALPIGHENAWPPMEGNKFLSLKYPSYMDAEGVNNAVPVKPGASCELSFWFNLKSTSPNNSIATISETNSSLNFNFDWNTPEMLHSFVVDATGSWQRFSGQFIPVRDHVVFLISAGQTANATIYVDDIQIKCGACTDPNDTDCVETEADNMMYVVYDQTKLCDSNNKGCARLGKSKMTNVDVVTQGLFVDTYVKNNPDKYNNILCEASGAGCEEWVYGEGQASYFKDPLDNVCEFRISSVAKGINVPKKWYKRPIKRCDMDNDGVIDADNNGNITESQNLICQTSNDCAGGDCIMDNNDYLCEVDNLKTIGFGGSGQEVYQPKNMVGVCEPEASDCTEYIDPVSEFSPNILVNPSFQDINGDTLLGDSWDVSTDAGFTGLQQQDIRLVPNKLYNFSVKRYGGSNSTIYIKCLNDIKQLLPNNNFVPVTNNTLVLSGGENNNILFNSLNNSSCRVYGGHNSANGNYATIAVRGVVVEYQIASEVDKQTCNGAPQFDNGCIMFNERKVAGASGLSQMIWSAFDASYETGQTNNICGGNNIACDTNSLIKVRPNRVCEKWLACSDLGIDTVTGESTCYAMGECNRVDDTGYCSNFVETPESAHIFNSGTDRNVLGYSKLNSYYLSNMVEVGENVDGAHFNFEDSVSYEAARWSAQGGLSITSANIINNAASLMNNSNVSYPALGKGMFKVPSAPSGSNGWFETVNPLVVSPSKKYYINFLVNIDDLQGDGAHIKILGTDNAGNVNWSLNAPQFSVTRGSGWQRIVGEFTPPAAKIKLLLETESHLTNTAAYFDDINIEPVLKVNDNEYIPKDCRLYPAQDSLTCKSINGNVVSNGIYGYCLEYDPKNPESCLMWYPVEAIGSSEAAQPASTGYNGVDGVEKPYYCADVQGIGKLRYVEERVPYSGSITCRSDCASDGNPCGQPCDCDDLDEHVVDQDWCSGNVCGYSLWFGACDRCYLVTWVIPQTASSQVSMGVRYTSGNTPGGWNDVGYFSPATFNPVKSMNGGNQSWEYFENFTTGNSVTGCQSGVTGHLYTNTHGWYDINNNTTDECYGLSGTSNSTNILDSDGQVRTVSAYLTNYKNNLKCSKYVRGVIPWVARLTDRADSENGFFTSGYTPYNKRTTALNPYGSVSSDTNQVVGNNIAGMYGCTPNSSCTYAQSCGSPLGLTGRDYSAGANSGSYKTNLKQIWLSTESAGSGTGDTSVNYATYDYSNNSSGNVVPPCNTANPKTHRDMTTQKNSFCYVQPSISNVEVKNKDGVVITPNSDGTYPIRYAGFYTLSFNTYVDNEQAPIASLKIDWDDGTNISSTYVDSKPNVNKPFQFIHRYNPNDPTKNYNIKIRIKDRWAFWDCKPNADDLTWCSQ